MAHFMLLTVCCRFATGPALYNSDALIQEFYTKEAPNSVSNESTYYRLGPPPCRAARGEYASGG